MIADKFKKLQAGAKPEFNQKILEQFDHLRDHYRVKRFEKKYCNSYYSVEKTRKASNDYKRSGITNNLQIR
jgi:hypothetical protein